MKKLTKGQKLSLIRHTLSAIGGILIAYGVVSSSLAQETIGAIMALTGTVWSFIDKKATIDRIQGTLRQILTVLGGFVSTKGILAPDMVEAIVAALMMLISTLLGQTDKIVIPEDPEA
jgi:hypothetical protein